MPFPRAQLPHQAHRVRETSPGVVGNGAQHWGIGGDSKGGQGMLTVVLVLTAATPR